MEGGVSFTFFPVFISKGKDIYMVYAKDITEAQAMYIPKDGKEASGAMAFTIENTTDHNTHTFEVISTHYSDHYYLISVEFPNGITAGEYKYTLTNGGDILSTGLLVVGEGDVAKEYNKIIQYEQYEQ